MKLLIFLLACSLSAGAQYFPDSVQVLSPELLPLPKPAQDKKIKLEAGKWRMTGNRWLTGGLVFVAGASKGFNETLMFHWKAFRHRFPNANPQWYNPNISWRNKYKNGDPEAGPKFPLSTSVLVAFTDQYHLNTMLNRLAWTSVLVIKIGEGKKPFKHYLLDFLYYSACHQAGFALTYYPFNNYKGN